MGAEARRCPRAGSSRPRPRRSVASVDPSTSADERLPDVAAHAHVAARARAAWPRGRRWWWTCPWCRSPRPRGPAGGGRPARSRPGRALPPRAPPRARAAPRARPGTPRPSRRAAKVSRRCPPSSSRTPSGFEPHDLRLKLPRRLAIRCHHRVPPPREELRRRNPRPREPDDHDGMPRHSHGVFTSPSRGPWTGSPQLERRER